MKTYLSNPINIPLSDAQQTIVRLCRAVKLRPNDLSNVVLHRQSVDARKKDNVHFVCSYRFSTAKTPQNATPYAPPADVLANTPKIATQRSAIVVGSGPAGLFAALYLAKCGVDVTVVERGSDVTKRAQTVRHFFQTGQLNPNCNVQYGLGGAGTFSDGKLTSGISSPLMHTVFQQFVRSGAPKQIVTDALPHIGTDKLVNVVANLRDEIVANGGKFLFDTTVTNFLLQGGKVTGVVMQGEQGGQQKLLADNVVLACGHSARDVFACLAELGANVSFKPFAVGVRIEHTREFINKAQYGALFATHRDLPTASYKLVCNLPEGRSCYSFCMCPGGTVVAATSANGAVVVNGMSNFARDGQNSNSALVVNVTANDVARYGFGTSPTSGIAFQQHLEQLAYTMGGGGFKAPCQSVADFVGATRHGETAVEPTYPLGVTPCNLEQLFPADISNALKQALAYFDTKIKGFGASGVLTGVETRTSSPIKIVRDEVTLQSNLANLYPTGEGAGYAGGIVSSAVDGLRVAMAIVDGCK